MPIQFNWAVANKDEDVGYFVNEADATAFARSNELVMPCIRHYEFEDIRGTARKNVQGEQALAKDECIGIW